MYLLNIIARIAAVVEDRTTEWLIVKIKIVLGVAEALRCTETNVIIVVFSLTITWHGTAAVAVVSCGTAVILHLRAATSS